MVSLISARGVHAPARRWPRLKRSDTGDRAAQYQGMYVVRALVGIDGFKVEHVAHHRVFIGNSIATQHISSISSDCQRLATRIALDHRYRLGR